MGSSVPRARDGSPAIPRLIETADEAREIAAVLGGSNSLFIGANAQEHSAKMGELKSARYVLFATHGFLGGGVSARCRGGSGGRRRATGNIRRTGYP